MRAVPTKLCKPAKEEENDSACESAGGKPMLNKATKNERKDDNYDKR